MPEAAGKKNAIVSFLTLIVLIGLALLSKTLTDPPPPLAADAPPKDFSAMRAVAWLRRIAGAPHPMGTAPHAELRKYLLDQLDLLGVETQVQEATVSQWDKTNPSKAYVYNIIGLIKGKTHSRSVVLVAHYDSQPNSPGAADDGSGIAVLLETARALKSGEQLNNDVLLLMTDGEEYGLFGATAFLRHPLAKQAGVFINMEARGNSGPAITFEMNSGNGWIADAYARAAPYPLASSLFYQVYRMLPNNTDFSVFRSAGYTGVNSAFVDGFVNYHKLTDTYQNINASSIQHQGSNLLGLARYLGNARLDSTKAPDKVFFNPAGQWIVEYGASVNTLSFIIVTFLLIATLLYGVRKRTLTPRNVIYSSISFLVILVIIAGVITGLNSIILFLMPFHHSFNGSYGAAIFYAGFASVSIALFFLLTRQAVRPLSLSSMLMGSYIFIYLLALVQFIFFPLTIYVLVVPLTFALLFTLIRTWRARPAFQPGYANPALHLAGILPAIFILFPLSYFLFTAFDLQLPFASQFILLLLAGFCLPLIHISGEFLNRKKVHLYKLPLLVVGLGLIACGILNNEPVPARPLSSQVAYYLDADSAKACWITGSRPDNWNKQFFTAAYRGNLSGIYPFSVRQQLKNDAVAIDALPPLAESISDSTLDDSTHLQKMMLRTMRNAAHMEIMLIPDRAAGLLKASVNGENIALNFIKTPAGDLTYTPFYGLPLGGKVDLELIMRKNVKLRLIICDISASLPYGLAKFKRPDWVIPEQGNYSNITVVKKSYMFQGR